MQPRGRGGWTREGRHVPPRGRMEGRHVQPSVREDGQEKQLTTGRRMRTRRTVTAWQKMAPRAAATGPPKGRAATACATPPTSTLPRAEYLAKFLSAGLRSDCCSFCSSSSSPLAGPLAPANQEADAAHSLSTTPITPSASCSKAAALSGSPSIMPLNSDTALSFSSSSRSTSCSLVSSSSACTPLTAAAVEAAGGSEMPTGP